MLQNNLLCMTVRSVILIAYVSTILISAEVRSGTEPYLFCRCCCCCCCFTWLLISLFQSVCNRWSICFRWYLLTLPCAAHRPTDWLQDPFIHPPVRGRNHGTSQDPPHWRASRCTKLGVHHSSGSFRSSTTPCRPTHHHHQCSVWLPRRSALAS